MENNKTQPIKVQTSQRKKKREMNHSLGKDILRFIAEPLTNSDDSYRRLESKNLPIGEGLIVIRLIRDPKDKTGYAITVTDHAEGMSKESLEKIFGTYGEDNAGGVQLHARGIFGQGASDVLQNSAYDNKSAEIVSIKDGKVSKLRYNIDDNLDSIIFVNEIPLNSHNRLNEFRSRYNIPNNGTCICFGIPRKINFNSKAIKELPDNICKYPSFRYLLNQKNRKIVYIDLEGKEIILSSKDYQFEGERLLYNKNFSFNFEQQKLGCTLKIYKNDNKNEDNTQILVRDENYSVFDNTLFGYENYSSARNISGELIINGLYDLCYKHLNDENNPNAIVNDNRTGFDTKNPFYKELLNNISDKIKNVLDENGKDLKTIDLANDKKINQALNELNKYIKSELKENIGQGRLRGNEPPGEGFRFARNSITITRGKRYNVKVYINPNVINENESIIIDVEDNNSIKVKPEKISYNLDDIKENLVIKNIEIEAVEITENPIKIVAKWNNRQSSLLVDVIEEDIFYPEDGMGFNPKEYTLVYNKNHVIYLFVDTSIIPFNSKINIIHDGLNCENSEYILSINDLVNSDIAKISITLNGGDIGSKYEVIAKSGELETQAIITLIEESSNPINGNGLIAGFKIEDSNQFYQAYYNMMDHYIYINSQNPINKKMMGNMENIDKETPQFSKEQRKYLCDIISHQSAKLLVKHKNIKNGDYDFENEDSIDQIIDDIQRQKNTIFTKMYGAIVNKEE